MITTIVYLLVTVCQDNHQQNCQMYIEDKWRGQGAMEDCRATVADLEGQLTPRNRANVFFQCYPKRERN